MFILVWDVVPVQPHLGSSFQLVTPARPLSILSHLHESRALTEVGALFFFFFLQ